MAQQILSTNTFTAATWIVNSDATKGTHTTLAGALTSASSGDSILLQTSVTENVVLKAGVDIFSPLGENNTPHVTITGKLSASFSGTCTISGIKITSNSDFCITLTGANVTIVRCFNCFINGSNNTAINSTGSNAASIVEFNNCTFDLGTTGITYFNVTNGVLNLSYCTQSNSGASTTLPTISGTNCNVRWCYLTFLQITSACLLDCNHCYFESSGTNTTSLTFNSSAASFLFHCYLSSGTATPLVITSGTLNVGNTILKSSNATAVSGAGTLVYSGISQIGTVGAISATTITPKFVQGAINSTTPASGMIGEEIIATVTNGSPVALVNATAKTITSIVLTPGIWDISSIGGFSGYTTATQAISAISVNNNSLTGTLSGNSRIDFPVSTAANSDSMFSIPAFRVALSAATTTYYLVAQLSYTAGSGTGYGTIRAKRVA